MKLGITGSRQGWTLHQRDKFISFLLNVHEASKKPFTEAHLGDCVGIDDEVREYLQENLPSIRIVLHPPSNNQWRAHGTANTIMAVKPYMERNMDIVNASDVLIAMPDYGANRATSGTWQTFDYARHHDKPRVIIFPEGDLMSWYLDSLDRL